MKCATFVCISVLLLDITSGQISDDYFQKETHCYLEEMTRDERCVKLGKKIIEPSFERVNTTNGRYKIRFDFPEGCNYSTYTAELLVNEDIVRSDQCLNETNFKISQHLHTITKLKLHVTGTGIKGQKTCDNKTGVFYFQFVFSGCYWLRIKSFGKTKPIIETYPKYLDSEYQKRTIAPNNTTAGGIGIWTERSRKYPVDIRIDMNRDPWREMWLTRSTISFTLGSVTKQVEKRTWDLWIWPNRTILCKNTTIMTQQQQLNCEIVDGTDLLMHLSGVVPRNYYLQIDVSPEKDIRCEASSLWARHNCRWTIQYNVTGVQQKNNTDYEIPEEPHYLRIYGPSIAGVFVVLILTLVATKYAMKRRLLRVPEKPPIMVSIVPQRPAILLLYSRDCDAFMKLMVSFRLLLEQATEFEIYDCYDPKRWSEVSLDPSAWMQRLTMSRDIRVVVVASQCASLRQRAHLEGSAFHFATPHNMDKLFEYGLQLLTNAMSCIATYQTAFVVRFDGYSEDKDLFLALNSYTRFVLPSHMAKLLSSLKHCTAAEKNESWLNLKEGKILRDNLDNLLQFKLQNPEHLQKLLVITKNCNKSGIPLEVCA